MNSVDKALIGIETDVEGEIEHEMDLLRLCRIEVQSTSYLCVPWNMWFFLRSFS